MNLWLKVALLSSSVLVAQPALADIKVGVVTALSGNGSSIGIPYAKGIAAGQHYRSEVDGEKVEVIQLDDGSDPSAATRAARKLIEEDKVDILIGTATAPATIAIASVASELKVPYIAVSPVDLKEPEGTEKWTVAVPQPPSLMIKVVTDRMHRDGVQNAGYIGFSDAWGDFVYNGAKAAEAAGQFKVISNERYARTDTSVTGQILKILAGRPDAVLVGGSGTQGALPLLTLAERNFKGQVYGSPALINADFIRVAGKSAEGIIVSGGPIIVAEQLPDDHFAKKIGLEFRDAYKAVHGEETRDSFSAYTFDAWLIFTEAAARAKTHATPGTPEFRQALKDEIFATKDLAGVHAIYNYKPDSNYGVDERGLVLMKLENGAWIYQP